MYQHLISGSKNIYGNIFDYMQNLHTRNYAINCFVWKEKIAAFASNGDAYSCYRLVGENDFLLGNVRQHDFTVFSKPFEKRLHNVRIVIANYIAGKVVRVKI